MVTNNFMNAVKLMLANISNRNKSSNALIVKSPVGNTNYLVRLSAWPVSNISTTVRIGSSNYSGIWIGSGTTPPAATDYTLESRITSGATGTCTISDDYIDGDGNPTLKMVVTITNTGSESSPTNEYLNIFFIL